MPDLSTTYMGLKLRSPLVVSANPLSHELENILAMEDSGAGAVVLFSLFEEQIRQETEAAEQVYRSTTNTSAEASDFFPDSIEFAVGSEKYLELIKKAKELQHLVQHSKKGGIYSRLCSL